MTLDKDLNDEKGTKFGKLIESISARKQSKIVLALDPDYREDPNSLLSYAKEIITSTSEYVCAVKINFQLILPLSLSELGSLNEHITSRGMVSIADIKLNDIGNTNRIAVEYLWKAGFSAVIVNPFVGYAGGLDSVFASARERNKGVITLAFMSHPGAEEGYGLELKNGREIFEVFLERAKSWSADGVIMGSTRPEKIRLAKSILRGTDCKILSPGSGAQGGSPSAALEAGADFLIFGRSIIQSRDPKQAVTEIFHSLLPSMKEKN